MTRVRILAWMFPAMMLLGGHPLLADLIQGTSSGVFINPTGAAGMTTTGVNTSFFTWGDPDGFGTGPSSLRFTPTSFNVNPEVTFKIGSLDYFNGTITAGTGADTVDLRATLSITAPTGATGVFTYAMNLINTPNVGTPEEQADIVQLPTLFPSTIFSLNGTDYTLKLQFGNSGPGGFTTVDQFHVLEGERATADLVGTITADTSQVVPEPQAWMLLATAVGLTAIGRKRWSRP